MKLITDIAEEQVLIQAFDYSKSTVGMGEFYLKSIWKAMSLV